MPEHSIPTSFSLLHIKAPGLKILGLTFHPHHPQKFWSGFSGRPHGWPFSFGFGHITACTSVPDFVSSVPQCRQYLDLLCTSPSQLLHFMLVSLHWKKIEKAILQLQVKLFHYFLPKSTCICYVIHVNLN